MTVSFLLFTTAMIVCFLTKPIVDHKYRMAHALLTVVSGLSTVATGIYILGVTP